MYEGEGNYSELDKVHKSNSNYPKRERKKELSEENSAKQRLARRRLLSGTDVLDGSASQRMGGSVE